MKVNCSQLNLKRANVSVSILSISNMVFLLWGNVSDCCHEGMVIKGKIANRISQKDAKSYLCVTKYSIFLSEHNNFYEEKYKGKNDIVRELPLYY